MALWDCVDSVFGDPFGLCPSIDTLDVPRPVLVAQGLASVAVVLLTMIWFPYLHSRIRLLKARPEKRLIENLGRLPEPYSDLKVLEDEEDLKSEEGGDEESGPAEGPKSAEGEDLESVADEDLQSEVGLQSVEGGDLQSEEDGADSDAELIPERH